MKEIKKLEKKLMELTQIESTMAILGWDEQVMMPINGTAYRAKCSGYLSGLIHKKILELNEDNLLDKLVADFSKLDQNDKAIVRETFRVYKRTKNIPQKLVERLAEMSSKAFLIWRKAREHSKFEEFEPILTEIVDLKIEEAEMIGYEESPYDALLDDYEQGITTLDLDEIFTSLKNFLIPFIKKIKQSNIQIEKIKGTFPINQQKAFNEMVVKKMGFDFKSGRFDSSVHPFTTGFNPKDVRITTRYDEKDLLQSIMSSIHEAGHALYDQNLPAKKFGTPLGESLSFGFHESQSLFWERRLAGSKNFWEYFYPELKKKFNCLEKVSLNDFYKAINIVEPSFIRTDADEITYSLHIILRYELEKDLIEQKIRVSDLKKKWNEKMEEYLGLKVPTDTQGILQDVHWSSGSFGYFPAYALGNLYSAQILSTMKKELKNFDKLIATANFKPILIWLKDHIYSYGKLYTPKELIKKITGDKLNPQFFFDYAEEKYKDIYNI